MSDDPSRLPWNWEDPQELAVTIDTFTEQLSRCEKLELVAASNHWTRQQLRELEITGIEFAAFKTDHPSGLASDLVGPRTEDGRTERGGIYRVDDSSYFIELDISELLPFEDASVDWVYAEHLIEHVSLRVGIAWLTEVRRVLAPGGMIRITTPDLRIYASNYVNEDNFLAKHRRRMARALGSIAPPMPDRGAFMFNQMFYIYGHRWIFDREELEYALTSAGFASEGIEVRAFRQGARPDVADLDQILRNDETIYIEATI